MEQVSKYGKMGRVELDSAKVPGNLVMRQTLQRVHHLGCLQSYLPLFLKKCVYCSGIPHWDVLFKFGENGLLCSETYCLSCYNLLFFSYRNELSSDDSSKINEMLSHLFTNLFMLRVFLAVASDFFGL